VENRTGGRNCAGRGVSGPLGRIGNQSFDAIAGSIDPMFKFGRERSEGRLILDPTTGEPVGDDSK
jgi:phospholipase C